MMPHLLVKFRSVPSGVTLDVLLAKIVDSIPGAETTSEDWYAGRRKEAEIALKHLRKCGSTVSGDIVDTVDRAKARHPMTKGIRIPSRNGYLNGRISLEGFLLLSDRSIDADICVNLLDALQSLKIVVTSTKSEVLAPWKERHAE